MLCIRGLSARLASAALVALAGSSVHAVTFTCIPTPDQEAILRALLIRSPSKRATELRSAVREPLFSHDTDRRRKALRLLRTAAYTIDLEPIADLLSATIDPWNESQSEEGAEILARSRFTRASRASRAEVLRVALRDGRASFGHSPLSFTWNAAAVTVISDGLVELDEDVRQCLLRHAAESDLYGERAGLLWALDLASDHPPGTDPASSAAARLNSMSDEDFAAKMVGDPGFVWAVQFWEKQACQTWPFHPKVDPECAVYTSIARRQWKTNGTKIYDACGQSWCNGEHGIFLPRPFDWLNQFGVPRDSNFWCW